MTNSEQSHVLVHTLMEVKHVHKMNRGGARGPMKKWDVPVRRRRKSPPRDRAEGVGHRSSTWGLGRREGGLSSEKRPASHTLGAPPPRRLRHTGSPPRVRGQPDGAPLQQQQCAAAGVQTRPGSFSRRDQPRPAASRPASSQKRPTMGPLDAHRPGAHGSWAAGRGGPSSDSERDQSARCCWTPQGRRAPACGAHPREGAPGGWCPLQLSHR